MAQASQELQQLYSELINRMKQGVEMHEQLADYYGFLNLPGYQKCHEYQMLCELLTYRKAKDMYMREYNQLVPPSNGMNSINGMNPMTNMTNNGGNSGNNGNSNNYTNYANVIPPQWYTRTRYEVDSNTKRSAVRDGFKRWIEYERDTKQFLTNMEKCLEQSGDREGARRLDYLMDHVQKEIEHAEEMMMALENSGYDMNYILQQQEHLRKKYSEKIRELNNKDYQYRRRGSGNYANYNYDDYGWDCYYDRDDYRYYDGRGYDRRY